MESFVYKEMAELENEHWWFVARRAILKSIIHRFSLRGKTLEVGPGTGGNLPLFEGEVSVLEPNQEAINYLQDKNVQIIKGGIGEVSIDSDYDVIACLDVVEHLDNNVAGVKAVFEGLKSGGHFLITVPAFQFLWSKHDENHHHKRRYTKREIVSLLNEVGFEVHFASYFNFFLFPLAVVGRMLGQTGAGKPNVLLNFLFEKIFSFERFFLNWSPLPIGLSIVVVAKKP
jgi:SAM-dependent methyltransferase